jgi:hypothetical protein
VINNFSRRGNWLINNHCRDPSKRQEVMLKETDLLLLGVRAWPLAHLIITAVAGWWWHLIVIVIVVRGPCTRWHRRLERRLPPLYGMVRCKHFLIEFRSVS